MLKLRERLTGPNSSIAMLIVAAAGAVLFTIFARALLYTNTQRLINAADWVEHSQEVLSSLQNASQLAADAELNARIYLLSGEQDRREAVVASVNRFDVAAQHIKSLVSDNPQQTASAGTLVSCSSELGQALGGLNAQSTMPSALAQRCQQTIRLMAEREQRLLKQRQDASQRSSLVSLATDSIFVGLSLVTLIILFGFLLRDAVLRQRLAKQTAVTNDELAQSVKELKDRAQESEFLTSARDELQLCVELKQVYQSATRSFARLLPESSGALCITNNSRQMVEVVSSWGVSAIESFSPPESCCGLRSGQPRWREPGASELQCNHFAADAPERYLCVPIVAHGNTMGVLYVQFEKEEVLVSIRQRMDGLRQLLQLTGMAIASLNLRTTLEHQSLRDPLTGLFNHHFMQVALERELSRATRHKTILAVFMLDVDHFKKFNDTFGHAAGDAVLKAASDVFRTIVRAEDIVCRYGGEEFTIIVPDIAPETAYARAESIRLAVADLRVPIENESSLEVTVSLGVALYPNDGKTADQLLSMADQALYRAKRQGRNQVSLCEG